MFTHQFYFVFSLLLVLQDFGVCLVLGLGLISFFA